MAAGSTKGGGNVVENAVSEACKIVKIDISSGSQCSESIHLPLSVGDAD